MSKVLVERQGRDAAVLVITLNRPDARNAVDRETCELVGDAVEEANDDPKVRALVITGSGDQAFSAGADLKAISRGEQMLPAGREHWSFASFVNHFTDKPTIAAVNGDALGGGMELALSCDLIVAVETASFGLPEVKRGLMAAAGGVFRLPQQLPPRVALKLIMLGEPMPALEALRWGLINDVVAKGQALARALEFADRLSQNAPLAVQASKRIAYGVFEGPTGRERAGERLLWEQTATEMLAVMSSEDAQEGPRAFAEKRAPKWRAR